MRVTADKEDPDYRADMIPSWIYLNGEPLMQCFWADDETGEAEVAKLNAKGQIYIEDGEVARHIVRGHIRIEKRTVPGPEGFDAWMKARTDAAHASYMARHAAGGKAYL